MELIFIIVVASFHYMFRRHHKVWIKEYTKEQFNKKLIEKKVLEGETK